MSEFMMQLPDNCPPDVASQRELIVYRIVKTNPPTLDDFKTHAQLGLAPHVDYCRRCSLSLFDSYSNAMHRLNLSPKLGAHVAQATLTPAHGLISPVNKAGHMEWWAYKGKVMPDEFTVSDDEY